MLQSYSGLARCTLLPRAAETALDFARLSPEHLTRMPTSVWAGFLSLAAVLRMITICLNGENRSVRAECTVAQLIAELGLGSQRVAVVRNGEVVPRDAQSATVLAEGDCVDVIHMVGGG